jgi:hypothetical protein
VRKGLGGRCGRHCNSEQQRPAGRDWVSSEAAQGGFGLERFPAQSSARLKLSSSSKRSAQGLKGAPLGWEEASRAHWTKGTALKCGMPVPIAVPVPNVLPVFQETKRPSQNSANKRKSFPCKSLSRKGKLRDCKALLGLVLEPRKLRSEIKLCSPETKNQ